MTDVLFQFQSNLVKSLSKSSCSCRNCFGKFLGSIFASSSSSRDLLAKDAIVRGYAMHYWSVLLGIPIVEVLGYLFHRFLDHGHIIQRVEYEHWKHHFKHYPPENLRPDQRYKKVNAIEWKVAGPVCSLMLFVLFPFEYALPILAGSAAYAVLLRHFHRLFHLRDHYLSRNTYFLYLRKIHDIHHLNTTKNFTIINPIMDAIAGTYSSTGLQKRNALVDFNERYARDKAAKAKES